MIPGEIIFWIIVISGASGCLIWKVIDDIRNYRERKKVNMDWEITEK